MIFEIDPLLVVGAAAAPAAALLMWISYLQGRKSGYKHGQTAAKELYEGIKEGTLSQVETIKQDFLAAIAATIQAAKQRRDRKPKPKAQGPPTATAKPSKPISKEASQ